MQHASEVRFFPSFTITKGEDQNEQGVLEVFENNDFRNLLHLKIEMTRASDEDAKKWLAKKLLLEKR